MRLVDWMRREGIDDDALAHAVKSHRGTISRIRRGVNNPSWALAARIKAFTKGRVRADDFLPTEQ
jgi:DNA-binding XRE family transcriptional regulator